MIIDVIIPTYKPGKALFALLDSLLAQTLPVHQIILMNTEEGYFEELICGTRFYEKYDRVKVYHLSKEEFDHGKTRHLAVEKSQGDVFVMMTQDAMPADERLLEELTKNLSGKVAAAYARQLPGEDSDILEKISRDFNYPDSSRMKSMEDLESLGIKTYFCSNVCCAYRKDIYEKLGGFERHTIFNEDMIFAAKAIQAGFCVSYEAAAKVYHSHNYTNMQQLRRNFDLGVSQAMHPDIFAKVVSESEGRKLVSAATGYLRKQHMLSKLPHFYAQCGSKYIGYFLGKHFRMLPKKWVLCITTNREYWKQ